MKNSQIYGIVMGLMASFFYAMMGLLVHLTPTNFPSTELLFVRAIFSVMVLSVFLREKVLNIISKEALLVWGRSVFGALSIACFYFSLRLTSFANANVMADLAPIFVPIFSMIFFRTNLGHIEIFGLVIVILGFTGINSPNISPLSMLALTIGLLGAAIGALAYILLGKAAKQYRKSEIVFCQGIALLFCAITLPGESGWRLPDKSVMPMILGAAALGLLAQLALTESYKFLNPVIATALTLTVCMWGIGIESLVTRNIPSLATILVYVVTLIGIYLIQYPALKKKRLSGTKVKEIQFGSNLNDTAL